MTGTDIYIKYINPHSARVRSLNEDIKRASAKLYQRIRQHDESLVAALGNYDIHMYYPYTRPKQILH
jgi:hypothetical protein